MKSPKYIVFLFAFCFMAFSLTSCDSSNEEKEDTQNQVDVGKALNSATTEWGISRSAIIAHMDGYTQVQGTGSDILHFTTTKSPQKILYGLLNDKLRATAIVIPSSSISEEILKLERNYNFLGELNGGMVYENHYKNTMVTVWESLAANKEYGAIGFAPIITDLYEEAPEIVPMINNVKADATIATMNGKITGVSSDVEVGVLYGLTNNLSEETSKKEKTTSLGDFSLSLEGLIDDTTYYYQPYALVDDICYFGEIQSFKTNQLTYTIDGKTFKMIRVEGGPDGDFSIMQTEWPPIGDSGISFGLDTYGTPDLNDDGIIVQTEFLTFLIKLRSATNIMFRLPTRAEWEYAAKGGAKSGNYTYSGSNNIDDVAWHKGNSNGEPQPVAQKLPNELDLYDMSGNWAELCQDEQNSTVIEYYNGINGPFCGGSWQDEATNCKVTSWKPGVRTGRLPRQISEAVAFDSRYIGFRLVYSRK